MNIELRNIISDFQENVSKANSLLKKYLEVDNPQKWGPPIEQSGVLGGKYKYVFHGVGCKFYFSKTDIIDFDYGANGRIDGFDEWRLCCFISSRSKKYPNITESEIKVWFQEAVDSKEIKQAHSSEYGNLYYLAQDT